MNKRIKSILRCYAAGMGIKETASTFHTSRNTVRKYVRLFLSSGKSIEQFLSLSNEQLHEMFGCTESRHRDSSSRQIELKALLPGYVSRLTQKGTSVRKLFKEYHAEYPEDYQLSSFKRAVRQYKFHIKVVGHVEHYAADQMYIDFAGDRREVVDEMTGETKKAEVFVASLPFRRQRQMCIRDRLHEATVTNLSSMMISPLLPNITAVRSIPPVYAIPRTRPWWKMP